MNYEEKILIWKSKLLSEDVLSEDICNSLTQKIIDVESEIMKLGPSNYDKVPENTITAKHLYYNLLSYKWDELETLKNKIVISSSKIRRRAPAGRGSRRAGGSPPSARAGPNGPRRRCRACRSRWCRGWW